MDPLDEPQARKDGLQLDEHRRFQERFWTVERGTWCVFSLIIALALAGAFGSGGPLATKVTDTDIVLVEHPRIGRREGTDEMSVRFRPDPALETRSLFLTNSFAEVFQVEDIQPLPARTAIEADGQRLHFNNPGLDGGTVKLHLRAQSVGYATFDIAVDNYVLSLSSFIFP
ncbi:hypothetical protein [Agrobacterium sp.]|jgi:hypothetical protein|uniref:hypothetical protein n=1 Tax=Agrobacterium sp. TaxID=361 RepID=UPI0028AF01DC|nr:hypothetical protein [Agrobacterium sp.]